MKRKKLELDGFIPRRKGGNLEGNMEISDATDVSDSVNKVESYAQIDKKPKTGFRVRANGVAQSDIDDSLQMIDQEQDEEFKKQPKKRRAKPNRKRSKTKILAKFGLFLLIIGVIGAGGFIGYKALKAANNSFSGNPFDIFAAGQPLKEDENGRSNILIFGTAGDPTHPGGNLTDSIMVVSADQDKQDAYMISLPRDLYVQHSPICPLLGTNAGRINEAYFCGSNNGEDETAGANALRSVAGEVLGLDIQYFVHINFNAVIEGVDAVGGVDVTIESSDPRGILDRNFDWECNYQCYYVNYANGEQVHLDGKHALALARARNAAGGYGLPGGNFDREKNQQKVIKALRQKAISVGTLTNINKVTKLIDTLGNNLRTNFDIKEIKTMMPLVQSASDDNIYSIPLMDNDNNVYMFVFDNVNGASVLKPAAGLYNYTEIHEYIQKQLSSDPATKEGANIAVLNGSGTVGAATEEANRLEDSYQFQIGVVDNAPKGKYAPVVVYQLNPDMVHTAEKLESIYGITIDPEAVSPYTASGVDFVIIIGDTPQPAQ